MFALIFLSGDCFYTEELRELCKKADYILAADGGFRHSRALGLPANILIGDMDSISQEDLAYARSLPELEILQHSRDKNETDSELAVKTALEKGYKKIILAGALGGGRYDHMLANQVFASALALEGIDFILSDGQSHMFTITEDKSPFAYPDFLPYDSPRIVSLIAMTEKIDKLTIKGFAYETEEEDILMLSQRGVSNLYRPQALQKDRDGIAEKPRISLEGGCAMLVVSPVENA